MLISVPLRLCLSHQVPGCCPPLLRCPALRPLLQCGEEEAAWEVKLAALLLCATSGYDSNEQSTNSSSSSSGGGSSPVGQPGSAGCGISGASGTAVGGCGRCSGSGSCGCSSIGSEAAAVRSFWRRYRGLLPPAQQQCSLLFANEAELQLLQVRGDIRVASCAQPFSRLHDFAVAGVFTPGHPHQLRRAVLP